MCKFVNIWNVLCHKLLVLYACIILLSWRCIYMLMMLYICVCVNKYVYMCMHLHLCIYVCIGVCSCGYVRTLVFLFSFASVYFHPQHDDVIKWKHFPRNCPFVWGIHLSPANSPHKGQWRGALMFSLLCAWINAWVNNREAGDFTRHHAHYNVIVMIIICSLIAAGWCLGL